MGLIVPVRLDTCGHVTSLVFSESNDFNSAGSQVGFRGSVEAHHLTAKPRRSAMRTQGALLASWLSLERINSSPGWN